MSYSNYLEKSVAVASKEAAQALIQMVRSLDPTIQLIIRQSRVCISDNKDELGNYVGHDGEIIHKSSVSALKEKIKKLYLV